MSGSMDYDLTPILGPSTYGYYHHCKSDRRVYKVMVAFLFGLSAFHTITVSNSLYDTIINHYGNVPYLDVAPWSVTVGATLTGLTTTIAHAFFSWKVYIVSGRNVLLPVIIMALSLVSTGFAIACTVVGSHYKYYHRFHEFKEVTRTEAVNTDPMLELRSTSSAPQAPVRAALPTPREIPFNVNVADEEGKDWKSQEAFV
ncbi:hypothetical protein MNV49_003723 [Pseudohyphozyma bogoriensis]|nr:hypothetical protein MNV49_003723 [Pseudohyphozyma bogoriensis]